jgi:hypothetical protein
VSTFRQDVEITLDGEVFKCRSKAVDFTNAETQLAATGITNVSEHPMALRFRWAYCVFRRSHPEHPAAEAFGRFVEALDDLREEALLEGASPLDPTHAADSDG